MIRLISLLLLLAGTHILVIAAKVVAAEGAAAEGAAAEGAAAEGAAAEGDAAKSAAAKVTTAEPPAVDFGKDIMPLLQRSCVACHRANEAEGGLVLESYESLVKGGDSGPGVVSKESANSLLWNRASGAEEPIMPPEDNTVGAKPLAVAELDLIKRWIDQGAIPGTEVKSRPIQWETPASSLQATYAVATSADGRFAAASRGNQVSVYDQATGTELAKLIDPTLPAPATDLDLVQSIAFSPSGDQLATGGFKTVKLWRRATPSLDIRSTPLAAATGLVVTDQSGSQAALVNAIGEIELWNLKATQRTRLFQGLDGWVTALHLTAGGEQLVAATSKGQFLLWNAASGEEQIRRNDLGSIVRMTVSDDGKQLATIDGDRHVRWYRIQVADSPVASTLNPVDSAPLAGVTDATAVQFSHGSAPMLLVGTEAGKVLVIANDAGALVRTIEQGSPVVTLDLNADASRLAVATQDGKIQLWTVATGAAVITLQSNAAFAYPLKLAQRDAARLAANVVRQTARLTELETFATNEAAAQEKLQVEKDKAAETLAAETANVSKVAALVTTAEENVKKATMAIELSKQNLTTAEQAVAEMFAREAMVKGELETQNAALKDLQSQKQSAVGDAVAAIDAKIAETTALVATTQTNLAAQAAELVKLKTQVESAKVAMADAAAKLPPLSTELGKQQAAAKEAEAKKQVSVEALEQKEKAISNAQQATERAKSAIPLQAEIVAVHSRYAAAGKMRLSHLEQRAVAAQIPAVAVLLTDQSLVSAHANGVVSIYRVTDGALLSSSVAEPDNMVDNAALALLPLGDKVVVAARQQAAPSMFTVQPEWVLERSIGGPEAELISDRVTAIDFRPDGHSVAIGTGEPSRGGEVKLFSASTGELLKDLGRLHSDTVLGLRFSPDGSLLASAAADRTVRLTDVSKATVLRTLEGHTHHVLALAWNDDGIGLATAGADQTVKVWDSSDGSQRRSVIGFPKEVTAIAFLGSGPQFVTTCADGNVRIHDSTNGAPKRTMDANGDFLHSLATSFDGETVLVGGQSGQLRFWSTKDGQLQKEIK